MEPGHEGREEMQPGVDDDYAQLLAAMEPGHEGREEPAEDIEDNTDPTGRNGARP